MREKGQFSEFIGRWRQEIQSLWDNLPKDVRADMDRVIRELPIQRKEWRSLIERAGEHLRLLTGQHHQVAIEGDKRSERHVSRDHGLTAKPESDYRRETDGHHQ